MESTASKIESLFRKFLPSPFSIAIILTIITFLLTFWIGDFKGEDHTVILALKAWKSGLWNPGLMRFLVQMMLMLILGHILALSRPVELGIEWLLKKVTTSNKAIIFISLLSVILGLFNWGLALIVSAIFARKIGEHSVKNKISINYPLIVAAAYSSLMVWHGGLSGSAPSKVAEKGHLSSLMKDIISESEWLNLPHLVSYKSTVFSYMNLSVMISLVVLIPLSLLLLNKIVGNKDSSELPNFVTEDKITPIVNKRLVGAERLDVSGWFIKGFGLIIVSVSVLDLFFWSSNILTGINPDGINLLLLGLSLVFHKNVKTFLEAVNESISGASGILIQFPLYFGIMGLMNASGLVEMMSSFFVSISNQTTFPIFTYISAGIVNVFVPSGGGQWAIQGPVIIKASSELGIELGKSIMALAYGDQLTNMLQPFWALPLLGITKLKATDILPYTFYLFLIGGSIFSLALLIF